MRNIKSPHTVMVFEYGGRTQTMTRLGHLPARSQHAASVEGILQAKGVSGPVTIRHHEGSMFGKPGALVTVFQHEVK